MDIEPVNACSQLSRLTLPVTFCPHIDVCVRSQPEANDQSRGGKSLNRMVELLMNRSWIEAAAEIHTVLQL